MVDIENELIAIRNKLPMVSPKMHKEEIHHLSLIKSGLDMAISHLIKLQKLKP